MLDHISLSKQMTDLIVDMIEQRETELNSRQYPYPKNPGFDWWMDRYIVNYDRDANNGEFDHTSVIMVNKPELLRFMLNGRDCTAMARSITDYWKDQLTPGSPEYTSIVSVTNDAEKIYPIISGYMCSYAGRENVLDLPGYVHLFRFIENAVKTIEWTVTEVMHDPYIVKIN